MTLISHWPLHAAAAVYALNLGVGLGAQLLQMHFGVFHHWLYALVFAAAILATLLCFHWALLVTLLALAAMPLTKPGKAAHPSVAGVGALGYLLAYLI
uniref:Uncharacterized protein n=1 Tax=Pseudenhygromyxa salsuginis TaxID=442868 RepID=A0A3S7UVE1_9BACT|nr:hypothetical protein [Pseudenhygromyxa salsuginis]